MSLAYVDPPLDREGVALGQMIRSRRIAHGMSQLDLADMIGVGERSVRNWEHGAPPTAVTLLALATALRVRFVADPEHGWRVEEGTVPAPAVVVAGNAEAMHAALDRLGIPPAP